VEAGYGGEQFPKQASVKGGWGNWLRLPGRHHTREHWARAFDGTRWLDATRTPKHILTFGGDGVAIPEVKDEPRPAVAQTASYARHSRLRGLDRLEKRIVSYLLRCPHRSEGQGRDDVAYGIAAFLVRDLGLDDSTALSYLSCWDRFNTPPKGEERLSQILKSAHNYGTHSYGAGLQGGG
jgi:hypothetical protein